MVDVGAASLLGKVEQRLLRSSWRLAGDDDILVPLACVHQIGLGLAHLVGEEAATDSWRRVLRKARGRGAGSQLSKMRSAETFSLSVLRLLLDHMGMLPVDAPAWDSVVERLRCRVRARPATAPCVGREVTGPTPATTPIVVDDDPEEAAPCLGTLAPLHNPELAPTITRIRS